MSRWPRPCEFRDIIFGEKFTMQFSDEEWVLIKEDCVLGKNNAVCINDGRTFNFEDDSVVYPLDEE